MTSEYRGPPSSDVSLYIVWQGLARMTGGSRSSYHSRDMWRRRFYWRSRLVESAFNKDGAGACLANPLRSWPRLGCTESTAPGAALEESGSPVSSGASATSFPELAGEHCEGRLPRALTASRSATRTRSATVREGTVALPAWFPDLACRIPVHRVMDTPKLTSGPDDSPVSIYPMAPFVPAACNPQMPT